MLLFLFFVGLTVSFCCCYWVDHCVVFVFVVCLFIFVWRCGFVHSKANTRTITTPWTTSNSATLATNNTTCNKLLILKECGCGGRSPRTHNTDENELKHVVVVVHVVVAVVFVIVFVCVAVVVVVLILVFWFRAYQTALILHFWKWIHVVWLLWTFLVLDVADAAVQL